MENQINNKRRDEINSRLLLIKNEIKELSPNSTLVAVTKYSPIEDLAIAYKLSQYDFGENKVQDLKIKSDYFVEQGLDKVRWHMIGHLQTNKVKELLAIPNLVAIHSVDSLKLCEELIKREDILKNRLDVFLQFNTSHEEEKSGLLTIAELFQAIEVLQKSKMLNFKGLMTMGTIRTEDPIQEANRCFLELVNLKNEVENKFKISELKLSMGMSSDYQIALKFKSDFIRLGSTIFKSE